MTGRVYAEPHDRRIMHEPAPTQGHLRGPRHLQERDDSRRGERQYEGAQVTRQIGHEIEEPSI